jgi:hypothetical protein
MPLTVALMGTVVVSFALVSSVLVLLVEHRLTLRSRVCLFFQ